MSQGFTKLFNSILDSTVWDLPDAERLVWITMLAMADRNGVVEASIPGLARRARVRIEAVEAALKCFMSPDEHSRSSENDGRRVEKVDGGWRLLNYGKYRLKMSLTAKSDYMRDYMREYRARAAVKGKGKEVFQRKGGQGTLAERLASQAEKSGDKELAQRIEGIATKEGKVAAEFREEFYKVLDTVKEAELEQKAGPVGPGEVMPPGLSGPPGDGAQEGCSEPEGPIEAPGVVIPEIPGVPGVVVPGQ